MNFDIWFITIIIFLGKSSYLDNTKEYITKENKENKEISQKVGTKAEYLLKQLTHQSFHSRLEMSPVWTKRTFSLEDQTSNNLSP